MVRAGWKIHKCFRLACDHCFINHVHIEWILATGPQSEPAKLSSRAAVYSLKFFIPYSYKYMTFLSISLFKTDFLQSSMESFSYSIA